MYGQNVDLQPSGGGGGGRTTPPGYGPVLPSDKILNFKRLGLRLLSHPSLQLAQTFIGKAVFGRKAVPLGRIHLRPLQMAVIAGIGSQVFTMDREPREAVRWWSHLAQEGATMKRQTPNLTLTTDASNSGWGAFLEGTSASGRWSRSESRLHINHLELLAVLKAVLSFTRQMRNKYVAIHLDNVTATSYLNKEGGDTFRFTQQADASDIDFLSGSRHYSDASIPSRSSEFNCRRTLKGSGVKRVVPESSSGESDFQENGQSPDRSFCLPRVDSPTSLQDRRAAGINALVEPWNFSRIQPFLLLS